MFIRFYFVFLLLKTIQCTFETDQSAEQNLTNTLTHNYQVSSRPRSDIPMTVIFFFKKIISIDEKNQTMTSSSNLYMSWTDPRLTWDPTAYNNITYILIQVKKLWFPDLAVINSADSDIILKPSDFNMALVYSTGTVNTVYPLSALKTYCKLDMSKFPFDQQTCSIKITPWATSTLFLPYTSFSGSYQDFYVENSIWELQKANFSVKNEYDRFAYFNNDYSQGCLIFSYQLKRRPLFFMINAIFPCLVLNLLTIFSFGLPTVPKFNISITIFLTFSIYSVRIAGDIPTQSIFLPNISYFFLFSTLFTLLAFSWFILENLLRTWAYIPPFLSSFVQFLRRPHCRCFKKFAKKSNAKVDSVSPEIESTQEVVELENHVVNTNPTSKPDDKTTVIADVESCLSTLNRFVFVTLTISMFIFNLTIWLDVST